MEQLVKKIFIEGEIKLLTGTHIGGTNSAMGIGGPDSTVVRNPIDNKPYIPGSSLKGKMRALIEISDGTIGSSGMKDIKNVASDDPDSNSGKLFGTATNDLKQRPSKLIVRDAEILSDDKDFVNTDLPYTESKTEVVIDRITAKANPRQIERVPAGARFKLNMVLNVFNSDQKEEQLNTLFRGFKLLENDYLGGNGSRGYGQVKFQIDKVTEKEISKLIDKDDQGLDLTDEWKSKLD
ncbi:MAG: type III-A CRISPR-associated RAMP protein Csm3 [Bacteroidales bacterium]|nr:type III-A CRISPR-associated RAMP protein Csm3 [Bacteroidales bacterium]MCF8387702.1 type III-A CRISPR-associated RAMP protein Csm3 [Bacteroidales bacterium]MCF8398514.1 type III-A CRISPR-associated RAMP protein Csm3 [Bacteroidales bacterium]